LNPEHGGRQHVSPKRRYLSAKILSHENLKSHIQLPFKIMPIFWSETKFTKATLYQAFVFWWRVAGSLLLDSCVLLA
jgi:hypothetical protein